MLFAATEHKWLAYCLHQWAVSDLVLLLVMAQISCSRDSDCTNCGIGYQCNKCPLCGGASPRSGKCQRKGSGQCPVLDCNCDKKVRKWLALQNLIAQPRFLDSHMQLFSVDRVPDAPAMQIVVSQRRFVTHAHHARAAPQYQDSASLGPFMLLLVGDLHCLEGFQPVLHASQILIFLPYHLFLRQKSSLRRSRVLLWMWCWINQIRAQLRCSELMNKARNLQINLL